MLGGVSYDKVDDEGLHITVDGAPKLLDVDNVIVCAGQEPLKDLEVFIRPISIWEKLSLSRWNVFVLLAEPAICVSWR